MYDWATCRNCSLWKILKRLRFYFFVYSSITWVFTISKLYLWNISISKFKLFAFYIMLYSFQFLRGDEHVSNANFIGWSVVCCELDFLLLRWYIMMFVEHYWHPLWIVGYIESPIGNKTIPISLIYIKPCIVGF